jgi:glycosyltransferase involved in cell wall biosynthesis
MDRHGWRYNTSYHTRFPEFLHSIYGIPRSWTYAYLRWFHKHSGRVLTTTDTMVQELRHHGFQGDIRSWTRGVNREELLPTREFDHPNHPLRVLVVSRVSREKNLDAVCRLGHRFDVHVVGDGPYRAELEQKYPAVKFWGYQSGRRLADHYAEADVFAFSSANDTFGIVMIEAMSMGTPIAAFPVPGPQDVVTPGVTGWLDLDLERAIESASQLDRAEIRARSQHWTWQRCWEIFQANLIPR